MVVVSIFSSSDRAQNPIIKITTKLSIEGEPPPEQFNSFLGISYIHKSAPGFSSSSLGASSEFGIFTVFCNSLIF
jgi:hypothetical protein